MDDEAQARFMIGDRAQGYEVTGTGTLAGLEAAFAGRDTGNADALVTLIRLDRNADPSAALEQARLFGTLGLANLVGARALVHFGAGPALVIGSENGAPLSGETLARFLERRAPMTLPETARLFLPLIETLEALHGRGLAHGRLSAGQVFCDMDGRARLFAPFVADGGDQQAMFEKAQAPELVGGGTPNPASDIYSLATLLQWALTGDPVPAAKERLASRAQRDEDPLTSVRTSLPDLEAGLATLIETGLRLHPATRPQSLDALAAALGPHAGSPEASAGPPPLTAPTSPWSKPQEGPHVPPPLPPQAGPSRARPPGVPPVARSRRTSSIGEAPPPLPAPAGSKGQGKRRIGIGTIVSFVIALAVAWVVATGGIFSEDAPRGVDRDAPREQTPPTQVERPDDGANPPRKGPTSAQREETAEPPAEGVREQLCRSRFTFEAARDAGANALRAYLQQCDGIASDYVEAARDALRLN